MPLGGAPAASERFAEVLRRGVSHPRAAPRGCRVWLRAWDLAGGVSLWEASRGFSGGWGSILEKHCCRLVLLLVHPLAVIALGVRPALRTCFLLTFLAVVSPRLVPPAGIWLRSPIASGAQADPFCVSAAGAFPHCELPAELLFPSAFPVRV